VRYDIYIYIYMSLGGKGLITYYREEFALTRKEDISFIISIYLSACPSLP